MSRQPGDALEREEQKKRDELRGFLIEAAGLAVESAKPSEPEREPPPKPVMEAEVVTTEPTMRRGILFALLVSLATIAAVFFWPTPTGVVPDSIVGEWVTSSPKYPGRKLWISAIDVGFQTAGNMPLHPINKVSVRPAGEGERVVIDYQTASGLYTLDVTRTGERLAFTNQDDVVWTRVVRP